MMIRASSAFVHINLKNAACLVSEDREKSEIQKIEPTHLQMPSLPSYEALIASQEQAKNKSDTSSEPKMFMGVDVNNIKSNGSGEAVNIGLPGSGATLFNTMGIALPGEKKPLPRDPIPVTQEVRELLIKKKKAFGMTLRNFENGVFVSHVRPSTPAAKVGLRFGDQVLRIDKLNVAGMKGKDAFAHALSVKQYRVPFIIRDRPLERVVDLTRNEQGNVGLFIIDGGISGTLTESSAENNGVINRSQICEINGINVIGFPDEKIAKMIKEAESPIVRFTIIPQDFYNHLTKRLKKDMYATINRAKPVPLDP
nr:syndecan binding protein (syntenin) [Hymenolepis microstoma]